MELKQDFFLKKFQQNTEFGVSQVEFPFFLFRNVLRRYESSGICLNWFSYGGFRPAAAQKN